MSSLVCIRPLRRIKIELNHWVKECGSCVGNRIESGKGGSETERLVSLTSRYNCDWLNINHLWVVHVAFVVGGLSSWGVPSAGISSVDLRQEKKKWAPSVLSGKGEHIFYRKRLHDLGRSLLKGPRLGPLGGKDPSGYNKINVRQSHTKHLTCASDSGHEGFRRPGRVSMEYGWEES